MLKPPITRLPAIYLDLTNRPSEVFMKQIPSELRHAPNWFQFTSIQNVNDENGRKKGEFYSDRRVAQLDTNAISKHLLDGCFNLIHFPASFIRLWPSCHFDLGGGVDRDMAGGCSQNKQILIPYNIIEVQGGLEFAPQILLLFSFENSTGCNLHFIVFP